MTRRPHIVLLVAGAALAACVAPSEADTTESPLREDLGGGCDNVRMHSVGGTLADASDPCRAWVQAVIGRAVGVFRTDRARGGAGAIWTHDTPAGTALLLTSRHEFQDVPMSAHGPVPGELAHPPQSYNPMFVAAFAPIQGAIGSKGNIAFRLFTRPVPIEETQNRYNALQPKNDFVLAVVTPQTVLRSDPFSPPTTVDEGPLAIDDPNQLSSATSTGTVRPGDRYLAIGTWGGADLFYSVGRAATEEEAKRMLTQSVGAIAYDHHVEFLVKGRSEPGMSGGGVFDQTGRYAGVLVRGGESGPERTSYFRVVRASYVAEALQEELVTASPVEAAAVKRFLPR